MRLGQLCAFVLFLFTGHWVCAAYVPPAGYERTPNNFAGEIFAVAPNGAVAIGHTNFFSGGASIEVFASPAAAQLGTSPIQTFSDPTFKTFGDLTFDGNNTLLFTENKDNDTAYSAAIGTGSITALAPLHSMPNAAGIASAGGNIFVVAANNPTAGALYKIGTATALLTGIGTGYLGGLAIDSSGELLLTDSNDPDFVGNPGMIRKYSSAGSAIGTVSLAGGNGSGAYDITIDGNDNAFVSTGSTLTRVPAGGSAEQFGSTFGNFPFISDVDFLGDGFAPFNGDGKLFVNATFGDDLAIIGIQTPEPTAALLICGGAVVLFTRFRRGMAAVCLLVAFLSINSSTRADTFYASQVISNHPGTNQQAGFGSTAYALGGPRGQVGQDAGTDVYCLGNGGDITLGFSDATHTRYINNQTGADFIVFENAIYKDDDTTRSFAELIFVAVSSDGINFAQFPVISNTASSVGSFGTINPANVSGFAGVHPVFANVDTNSINPFDASVAGGDAFDLSALAANPAVLAGSVNLNAITQVRLIDVIGDGTSLDLNAHAIYDPTGTGAGGAGIGGADVDAISVIHGVLAPEPCAALLLLSLAMLKRKSR